MPVNHMFEKGIRDVNFIVCNTDQQALSKVLSLLRCRLLKLYGGPWAGSQPEIGRKAAIRKY